MEEERRLAFVAMTRAEKRLYLSEADSINSDSSPRYPSRFLLDIDQSLLEYTKPPQDGLIRDASNYIRNAEQRLLDQNDPELYPVGTRVQHAILGAGTVLDLDKDNNAYVIQFDTLPTPRTIAFRVKLTRA
jgi:DNA helicase-2/ATP-dependent DNA helicase PcrA